MRTGGFLDSFKLVVSVIGNRAFETANENNYDDILKKG